MRRVHTMIAARATATSTSVRTITTMATCVALLSGAALPTRAAGQIRNRGVSANYGWWISGGASGAVLSDITDGASQSRWKFGSDPLYQYRGSLEKALDEFTSIGIVGGYGKVNLTMESIAAAANTKLPTACQVSCPASTEMWTGLAQFRTGGGEGFHTLFEASAGATTFRKFSTQSDGLPIAGIKSTFDLTGTLGPGFGYSLSRNMAVTLVQDFGIGFHAKTDLPSGTGRSWRVRNTRAAIRLKFGGR